MASVIVIVSEFENGKLKVSYLLFLQHLQQNLELKRVVVTAAPTDFLIAFQISKLSFKIKKVSKNAALYLKMRKLVAVG